MAHNNMVCYCKYMLKNSNGKINPFHDMDDYFALRRKCYKIEKLYWKKFRRWEETVVENHYRGLKSSNAVARFKKHYDE